MIQKYILFVMEQLEIYKRRIKGNQKNDRLTISMISNCNKWARVFDGGDVNPQRPIHHPKVSK